MTRTRRRQRRQERTADERREEALAMDPMTAIEVEGLEKLAALREHHAEEREARAAVYHGGGSSAYIETLVIAEQYRNEARELRARATQLRRQSA
ncbi:hypothetical protein [Brevibacterium linens]|nr:hypothetical protein [Brevibacterium linens]